MTAAALAATLLFTLPSTGQLRTVDPSQGADSFMVECSGGQAIHQLATARLYYIPLTGGGWRIVQTHSVTGKEGAPDSFQVTAGGHYYVTVTNPIGESCASNVAYVPDPTITGVPDGPPPAHVVSSQLFDVQGRRVQRITRSGVYFRRILYDTGEAVIVKVVMLK